MDKMLKKILKSESELSLFRYIHSLGGMQFNIAHSTKFDRTIEQQEQIDILQNLMYEACLQTTKYGTEFIEKHPTDKYWDWYNKWKLFIDSMDELNYNKLTTLESKSDFISIKSNFG